jgi:hypothetical protein
VVAVTDVDGRAADRNGGSTRPSSSRPTVTIAQPIATGTRTFSASRPHPQGVRATAGDGSLRYGYAEAVVTM